MDDDTKEVQARISANQNPEDCSQARYLLWRLTDHGMGSDLHISGWALGYALQHGRVLLYEPRGWVRRAAHVCPVLRENMHADRRVVCMRGRCRRWVYTDPQECDGNESPDCFFEPLSTCQVRHVTRNH
jgi:hypothetical protein